MVMNLPFQMIGLFSCIMWELYNYLENWLSFLSLVMKEQSIMLRKVSIFLKQE